MADGRLLHKRASNGKRVIALDDFDFRVWVQYVLSADDYGVMRASSSVLMADNRRLEIAKAPKVEAAMGRLEASGLIEKFEHQGLRYWWQTDWQDFQGVKYPRATVNPKPSDDLMATATPDTKGLFALHGLPPEDRKALAKTLSHQKKNKLVRDDSENGSQIVLATRAGGHETLTLTPTLTPPGSGSVDLEESTRETTLTYEPDVDTGGPVSDTPPVWSRRRSGALARAGTLVGDHSRCLPCASSACERGACVPGFLAQQWLQQLGGPSPEADAEIREVVIRVVARLRPGALGDDPLKFWRAEWQAEHGSQARTAPTNSKGQQTVTGVQRGLERYAEQKARR